ncbi:MAG: hypothetical protein CVV63_03650, partial [Tenericutes bacterium HGW-Tenericutes-8]
MIKLCNIQKKYGNRFILENLDLNFDKQGLYLIYGENGVGKTTLLNILSLFDQPSSGNILYNNQIVDFGNQKQIDFIRRQVITTLSTPAKLFFDESVYFNIKTRLDVMSKTYDETDIDFALEKYGLIKSKMQDASTLSSGETKLLQLVIADLSDTSVIICDEPLSNLDELNKKLVSTFLKEVAKKHIVIISGHKKDIIEADYYFDVEMNTFESKSSSTLKLSNNDLPNKKRFTFKYKTSWLYSIAILTMLSLLLGLTFSYYAVSSENYFDSIIYSLEAHNDYTLPITSYEQRAIFTNYPNLLMYGNIPTHERVDETDVITIQNTSGIDLNIAAAYFFNKYYHDFIDYDRTLFPTPELSLYENYFFKEVIIVEDFNAFKESLAFGSYPIDKTDILVYDFQAMQFAALLGYQSNDLSSLIGFILNDQTSNLSFKIKGIIKTNYESFSYLDSWEFASTNVSGMYLSKYQVIYALPELLEDIAS